MCCSSWGRLAVVVGLILFAGQTFAHGLVPKSAQQRWCTGGNAICRESFNEAAEADLRPRLDSWKRSWSSTVTVTESGSLTCTGSASQKECSGITATARYNVGNGVAGTFTPAVQLNLRSVQSCPPDSTEKGTTQCECKAGFEPVGGECKPVDCGPVTQAFNAGGTGPFAASGGGTASLCAGGCKMQGQMSAKAQDGRFWTWGPFTAGGSCMGVDGNGNDFQAPPQRCEQGTCPGTVNGASVCVPCQASESKDGTTTKTNPDGSKTQTTKETKCDGEKCTVTTKTTEYDPQGNVIPGAVTTTQEEKPQRTFCQENPQSPMCKPSNFGGACSGGFSCDGDAIQCAIAREQHRRACEWAEVDQSLVQAGQANMTGELQPVGHPFANPDSQAITLSSVIDQSNPISGGCPIDQTFNLAGVTVSLPFSQYCDALAIMGNIAVAFAFLAALRIVFG